MREINIPLPETHSVSFALEDLGEKTGEREMLKAAIMRIQPGSGLLGIARNNAGKVVYAVVALEQSMGTGITTHMFGIGYPCTSQRNFFTTKILESSFLEFNAKREIYVQVLKEIGHIKSNKEMDRTNKVLRKVMSYRNSFAHGRMKVVNDCVVLEYYQGQARSDKLDEDYCSKLESAFGDAADLVKKGNQAISDQFLRATQAADSVD